MSHRIPVQFLLLLTLIVPALEAFAGCTAGNCKNGTGTFYYDNGDHYEGTFKRGKFHGKGVYYWNSGGRYEGGIRTW